MAWEALDVTQAHKWYAVLGVFSCLFCLISLFLKEHIFINEAVVSTFSGIICGPKVIGWLDAGKWSNNTDYLVLEVSKVILNVQLFAVSVELPPKYIKFNAIPLVILLLFTMIIGWVVTGAFAMLIFPKFNFIDALCVSAAITATDPVLSAAIVGKGKFSERIPSYLKHLISAESGANDGLAFPFVLLASNILIHGHSKGEVFKDWIVLGILYECCFGIVLGVVIGYVSRQCIKYCESKKIVDTEAILIFYIFVAMICTGFGSMLGVDDLLVSFFAGAAFAWDGWFIEKTHGHFLSSSIDVLLNVGYFVFYGTLIPWDQFHNADLGLSWWRLILWAAVIVFLRRIPATLMATPFVSVIHNWKESLFVGMFGPVGVGGIYCSVVIKMAIEKFYTHQEVPLAEIDSTFPHYVLLNSIWPIVSFTVLTSVIVHGFAVTVMVYSSKIMEIVVKRRKQNDTPGDDHSHDVEMTTLPMEPPKKGGEQGPGNTLQRRRTRGDELKCLQIGNEVLVENKSGELIKKYKIERDEDSSTHLSVVYEAEENPYDDTEIQLAISQLSFT